MITINELGMLMWQRIFWNTPYRTGNLARNGIGDFGAMGGGVGFTLFGKGTEYGAILNEVPVISYRVVNPKTGNVYTGSYSNKHYKWVDNFADQWAAEMPAYVPGMRRI